MEEWEFDGEGGLQGPVPAGSPLDMFGMLLEAVLTAPGSPDVEAGDVVVVAVMRCRADDFGPKDARQLGRVLVDRFHPVSPVSQAAMRVPRSVAAAVPEVRARLEREDCDS